MTSEFKNRVLRFVVHGHLGRGNVGDEAMLDVIVRLLQSRFLGCELFLAYGSDTHPRTVVGSAVTYFDRKASAIVSHFVGSDVFVIAGGTHLTSFGADKLRKLAGIARQTLLILAARLMGNRVWMLSVGLGPLESPFAKWLVHATLKMVDFVSVRDVKSLSMLAELKYHGSYSQCSDAAFYYTSSMAIPQETHRLGISVLPYFACHMRDSEADTALVAAFSEAIKAWLALFPRGEVCLLPVCSQGGTCSDTSMTRRIAQTFSGDIRIREIELQGSPRAFLQCMEGLSHFVGMRYHSVLFSHVLALPTLNVAYHDKNRELAAELGSPEESVLSIEDVLNGVLTRTLSTFGSDPTRYVSARHSALLAEEDILPKHSLREMGLQ